MSENAPLKVTPQDLGEPNGTRWVYAACGRNHTLLVGSDGSVWSAGANAYGQVSRLLFFFFLSHLCGADTGVCVVVVWAPYFLRGRGV